MPFKVLITQPSSDQPAEQPKKIVKKRVVKKLAKQKAQGDEDDDLFEGVTIDDDDAASLLAEIEGDSKAYESVEVDKSAQNRRSSAPSPYLHDENRQSETPASQNANSSRLSPNVMTQSYYSASDMDESDLLDGLSLDDEDAARLLEEFEVDEYDDAARRARSATPYGSSSAPVKKKKIIVKKKIVKKASESTPDKKSASTSNLASDKKICTATPAETRTPALKTYRNGIQSIQDKKDQDSKVKDQTPEIKHQANKAYGSQTLEKKPEEKASPWGATLERQPRKNEKKVSGPNSLPAPQEKPRSRTPTPAELKYGKLNDPTPRDALLDTIAKGGFKLKHVETNDKSSGVLKPPEQESRSSSVPPAPKLEAPKPPPLNRAPSPAQLKFSDPEPSARQALLNAINAGGFKLRKVETNDRSGLVVDDDERKARSSSQPAPPPPPPGLGQPPAMNRAPSPAVLKHGKGEASARDELFNAINAGGFKLRKVETKDKSGLIVDDEMKASACKIVENQVAPPPPPPMPVKKAPPAPTPPPPPPAAPKAPKVSKPITNPKLLKLGGKDAQVNRAELLNTIKTGGFKLRKVEILDKSAPVLVENQDVATVSSSGYVSVAAPAPPPPPPPPAPGGPRKPKEVTNPAVLKLAKRSGKDVKPDIEALFKSIKSGGIKLRKVETNDKSGLILDDQQMAKKAQAETSSDAVPEAEPEKELPSQENGTEVKKKIKKTKIKVIKKAPA